MTARSAKPGAKPGAKSGAKPTGSRHLFVADPDTPGCCARCHLPGVAGDRRHTLPDVPEQAEHVRRYEGGER